LTQAADLSALEAAIPAQLRDPAGHWFALTMRARIVCASKKRVGRDAISYAELADPKWKGKLCMRSGRHVYNTSLFATLIAHNGEAVTEAWLRGVKARRALHERAGARADSVWP
jgi:iron(III) transport system substrate-binding protein